MGHSLKKSPLMKWLYRLVPFKSGLMSSWYSLWWSESQYLLLIPALLNTIKMQPDFCTFLHIRLGLERWKEKQRGGVFSRGLSNWLRAQHSSRPSCAHQQAGTGSALSHLTATQSSRCYTNSRLIYSLFNKGIESWLRSLQQFPLKYAAKKCLPCATTKRPPSDAPFDHRKRKIWIYCLLWGQDETLKW